LLSHLLEDLVRNGISEKKKTQSDHGEKRTFFWSGSILAHSSAVIVPISLSVFFSPRYEDKRRPSTTGGTINKGKGNEPVSVV
jgi:hypothetical protein